MSETLYRKYRPKNFREVIGQKHIVKTLTNSILKNRIGQAYLFTGPRGTGKTSIARILAKTINCEKPIGAISCEKCSVCKLLNENKSLDIIEIDAASNTGVDNIRELRETIALQPTSLKYKVYIIDEVHMLSTGAFNALLKTLEEPPKHVIFILATTEIHKVPETIISRCQRFDFTRLPIANIIEKLSLIAASENIKIDQDSLEMIALSAEGGMRDAESLLGQIISLEDKNITTKEVEEILGTADREMAFEIIEALIEDNSSLAIQKINALLDAGYDLTVFNKSLINYLRQLMLIKTNPELKKHFTYEMTEEQTKKMLSQTQKTDMPKILRMIDLLLEAQGKISSFMLPQLPLEMAFIKATGVIPSVAPVSIEQTPKKSTENPPLPKGEVAPDVLVGAGEGAKINSQIAPQEIKNNHSEENVIELFDVRNKWSKLLVDIKPFNHSLSALLANCQAIEINGNEIVLATPYSFYKDRLENPTNKLTIEDVFGKILGLKIRLKTIVDKNVFPEKNAPSQNPAPESNHETASLLDDALEIMGGKVVEE
jgi:DNA polymerase III subunit gamma/tau